MTALAMADVVDEVDVLHEQALLRIVADLATVARYNPLSDTTDEALRLIAEFAVGALDRLEGRT